MNKLEQLFDFTGLTIAWSLGLLVINITLVPIIFSVIASAFVIIDKWQSIQERKKRNNP